MVIGDRLPLGAPALMMSPQEVKLGIIDPKLVQKRDGKYNISTDDRKISRADLIVDKPEFTKPILADYWKRSGKGFAIDVVEAEMKKFVPFP